MGRRRAEEPARLCQEPRGTGGGRDGSVPVLTLPQRGFDVAAEKRWQIWQNRLMEVALSWALQGRAQALAQPQAACGTNSNDKMEKADVAAERCCF